MPRTETSIRGPGILPEAIALRRPTSIRSPEPRSRAVVKPISSVLRTCTDASSACSAVDFFNPSSSSCFQSSDASPDRCVCASMKPGITRRVAEIDHLGARRHRDRVARLHDAVAFDDDDGRGDERVGGAVEHPRRLDRDGLRGRRRCASLRSPWHGHQGQGQGDCGGSGSGSGRSHRQLRLRYYPQSSQRRHYDRPAPTGAIEETT